MKSLYATLFAVVLRLAVLASAGANPLYSPSWRFRLDLPEGYELSGGDGQNRFSFSSHFGASVDIAVYTGKTSVEALAEELEKKLSSRGERHRYDYNGKAAVLSTVNFPDPQRRSSRLSGWAFYAELEAAGGAERPMLFAVAYGPPDNALQSLHLSVLDSIAVSQEDTLLPGPVTHFSYPPGEWKQYPLAGTGEQAWFREGDIEAAQALVDREFAVLRRYADSPLWQEAWKRFYRAIYRDSFDRLKDAAFILERRWAAEAFGAWVRGESPPNPAGGALGRRSDEARVFAGKALDWIQQFRYERDLMGSDFVNLVSAARDGRGDCDSRAMLWALVLEQGAIPAGIMVSREFGHAMGLADIDGEGARFPFREGNREYRWLVAETTAQAGLGMIGENVSEITKWLGILFL
ncbi:MAG: hypothetical protein LBI67_00385 [Treponema sp.]|jgi:hypothetical protein|nr:hypothetical protein [Treponema sp.]